MSYKELFSRKLTACQASCQSFGGVSCTRYAIPYSRAKLGHIMRRKIGSVFVDLGPNELDRVKFWGTDRKVINMQARILRNEFLNKTSFVGGMVVLNQHDFARDRSQQLLQKSDHLFTTQAMPIRADSQFNLAAIWADRKGTQQVQPLMVRQAGADDRRMSTRRPTPLERRNQREAAFIFKHQRNQQLTPLFLSLARPAASRKQSSPRRFGSPSAAVSGCSSPFGPSGAKHHWENSEFQTVPKSGDQSAPESNNLLHTHEHMLHGATPAPISEPALPSGDWAVLAGVRSSSAGFSFVAGTDRRCE